MAAILVLAPGTQHYCDNLLPTSINFLFHLRSLYGLHKHPSPIETVKSVKQASTPARIPTTHFPIKMPPKRIQVQPARRQAQPEGYVSSIYQALTSEENASVVISVAMFGVSAAGFV